MLSIYFYLLFLFYNCCLFGDDGGFDEFNGLELELVLVFSYYFIFNYSFSLLLNLFSTIVGWWLLLLLLLLLLLVLILLLLLLLGLIILGNIYEYVLVCDTYNLEIGDICGYSINILFLYCKFYACILGVIVLVLVLLL